MHLNLVFIFGLLIGFICGGESKRQESFTHFQNRSLKNQPWIQCLAQAHANSTSLSFNSRGNQRAQICNFYGKVQVVHLNEDLRVQIVQNRPNLLVQKVERFPHRPGQWHFVKALPDLKIKFVKSNPDIRIKYVDYIPGCRIP